MATQLDMHDVSFSLAYAIFDFLFFKGEIRAGFINIHFSCLRQKMTEISSSVLVPRYL